MHDFDKQRRETLWVWEDIVSKNPDLAGRHILDLHFIPSSSKANWDEFEKALQETDYSTSRYDDESTLEAKTKPIELTAEVIWTHEKLTTEIALKYHFKPDGWGFLSG